MMSRAVVPTEGATCHTARATIDLLKRRVWWLPPNSRFGPVNWPQDLAGNYRRLCRQCWDELPTWIIKWNDIVFTDESRFCQQHLERRLELTPCCQVIYSQFGLPIHQNHHQASRRFFEWAQNEIAVVPDLCKRILFSDEAHFWLNGYVNKQNCRIWSEANPQVYVETPLHPEKQTVWVALWAGGIIGPFFFKNDEGHNVTVNGDRYRAMITNFFIPELNNHDVQELWFQQDGATCHTARATIDLLKDTFW
ncbi:hypothetical protein TNCV_319481 [Trichonephila clavipes]|nr:hypothetical protein TNCV_319481 [Trichonephila clavipes]